MKRGLALSEVEGFTIIELMTVMGVLAILMSITLIAINPSRQFKRANDGKRQSDVVEILNAINGYISNNLGSLPSGITTTPTEIGAGGGMVDLCTILVPYYVASLPTDTKPETDPITKTGGNCPTSYSTGYGVYSNGGTRVTVYSLTADLVPTISLMK